LKALYLRCSDESEQRLLTFDQATLCVMAAEALKRRSFDGSFEALLAWWRLQRGANSRLPACASSATLAPIGQRCEWMRREQTRHD
jgi:hypothetical protein